MSSSHHQPKMQAPGTQSVSPHTITNGQLQRPSSLSFQSAVHSQQQSQFLFPSTDHHMPLISAKAPQQRPPLQNQSHSRSSSFFSFRNKQSLASQNSGHHRTTSMGNGDGNGSAGVQPYTSPPLQTTPGRGPPNQNAQFSLQQQQPGMTQTVSVQSPLARAPSLQGNAQSPPQPQPQPQPLAPSPLHPEIRSVVQLTAAHAHKIYFSGPLVRRIERQADGQRPAKDEGWSDVWAQLGGTTLSIWDMKQIQEASKQGKEVPPTYVNMTDAFVQVLGSVTTPATADSPPKKYANVLTLNTAGSNLLLFSCPTTAALMSWAAALRLSAWEKSRLEEIYTAHLIRITLSVPDAPSTLVRGRMEGWVRIRIAGQTDWKRMWMVVSAGSETGPTQRLGGPTVGGIGGVPTPVAPTMKKKRMSNLFSRDNSAQQATAPTKPLVSMYASQKPKDKKKALLTITNMTQAFAVYPERPELISRSTLIKVEGSIGDEETAASMKSREGWILIMPELEGGLGQAAEMLKWVVALHDAFELYGRPDSWVWDPRDPVSLMFAYPVGPNKDLLFLDRELAETLDPRDERTSSIRSRLIGILLDRMRGNENPPPRIATSDKPPSLPPIGGFNNEIPQQQNGPSPSSSIVSGPSGPQLPPISFAGSFSSQPQEKKQLTPITERGSGYTNGGTSFDASSPYNSVQPSTGNDRPSPPIQETQDSSLFSRPLASSPASLSPPQSLSGAEAQRKSPPVQPVAVSPGPGRHSFDTPSINKGFQVQSRFDSNASPYSNLGRPSGDSGSPGGANPANIQLPLSPVIDSRPPVIPSPPAPTPSPTATVTRPRSPPASVLISPHSEAGHGDDHYHSTSDRFSAERASILTSPHSPQSILRQIDAGGAYFPRPSTSTISEQHAQLTSPYSPQTIPRNIDAGESSSSRSQHSPIPERKTSAKPEEHSNLFNEAGARYYMQQEAETNNQNQQRRVPMTIDEQDGDDSSSSSHYVTSHRVDATSPISAKGSIRKTPIRQGTPMAFVQRSSSQATSNRSATSIPPGDRLSPSRQGLGRKPSGARAQTTKSYNGDGISSSQQVTEEEETQSEDQHRNPQDPINHMSAQPSVSSEDPDLDALAALSYLDVEDKPSSPKQAKVEPLNVRSINKAPSPPPAPSPAEPRAQFKSSFAPSKQAAERKAKAEAQQAAHHAAVHKPGRANGRRKSRIAGTWNESSEEEEEDDDDDDDDDQADSDMEPALANKQGSGFASSDTSLRQFQNQGQGGEQSEASQPYSHLRPPRTLPQIPGNQGYPEELNPPPRRMASDQYSEAGRRTYHDGTQIRTQAEFPQPGAARQSVWSQVLEPGRGSNALLEAPRDTFVRLEPAETMTKAFTPQGLLSAGLQDKQDRSAKRQEELARETGASLINVPNKPPPPQMGLLGAITAHERDRKREGGVGAALTEREREKRVAEDRQRRFDDHQRQQLDQMQQGGSMYGGQFPGYNNMMGNPMMMMNPMMGMNPMMTGGGLSPMMTGGGMAPMMTGQMGYPGMMPGYNPQHMFAAQQAAQAYQQAMMAFSVAGSQVGGEGAGGPQQLNPAMTGGMGGFDPRMSMMGMPMMGGQMGGPQMGPMGMQMTGMSGFDPRFPPSNNSPASMNDSGLVPPTVFGGQAQGQSPSRNSSPVGRGSPLAQSSDTPERGRVPSRPTSPGKS